MGVRGNQESPQTSDGLAQARRSMQESLWQDAYERFLEADRQQGLTGEDLERLGVSAYMTGRDDEFDQVLDRAQAAFQAEGQTARASRCAFWLGLNLMFRGEFGRGSGWLATAKRLIEHEQEDCVEQGYLLLPVVEQKVGGGDLEGALADATAAGAIGRRFSDVDLSAMALHLEGKVLLRLGRIAEGLSRLDETMVAATAGQLSPIVTGLIYCSVIDGCQQVHAYSRAREWTEALAGWCDRQPQMIAFTQRCLVHRAEIMQRCGSWQEALSEARKACARMTGGARQTAPAEALYQEGEVHRLRGDFAKAEEAYTAASRAGMDPQPGMALLRLAQERSAVAVAAIRRALNAEANLLKRTRLLPAHVEIMLRAGETEEARTAAEELRQIAEDFDTDVLRAMTLQALGAVELAENNTLAALGSLRQSLELWQAADAPYQTAQVRALMAQACRAVGDEEGAGLELDGAKAEFERLGALPDVDRINALLGTTRQPQHGLTRRELQVLTLVAAGHSNKAIAFELDLSQKTVERHISNIFTKLDVPTRAAATAYAYVHNLL